MKERPLSLLDLLTPSLPKDIVELAVEKLLSEGATQLKEWYDAQEEMSGWVVTLVAQTLMDHSIDEDDFAEAYHWADCLKSLTGEDHSTVAWACEKKVALRRMQEDSKGYLEGVIKDGLHPPYFVSILVDDWIKRDLEAMRSWFDKAGPSLSTIHRDFISLSFIKELYKGAHRKAAKGWLARITTENVLALAKRDCPELFENADESDKAAEAQEVSNSSQDFVIFFSAAQGSSAIQSLIAELPDVSLHEFEPLDQYRFEHLEGRIYRKLQKSGIDDLVSTFFTKRENRNELYQAECSRFQIERPELRQQHHQGFKFRFMEWCKIGKEFSQSKEEQLLRSFTSNEVHIFHLFRRDILAQAFSLYKGVELQFKKKAGDLKEEDLKPVFVDLTKMSQIVTSIHSYRKFCEQTIKTLEEQEYEKHSVLYYEDFVNRPIDFLSNISKQLGVELTSDQLDDLVSRQNSFEKVHTQPLNQLIENFEEVTVTFQNEFQIHQEEESKKS